MISILASVAALPVLWFVWVKYQQTRWWHIADDFVFKKFEELKTIEFEYLVARIGQRNSVEEHIIDGHHLKIGWRVDKSDAIPHSFGNWEKIDYDDFPKTWSGQQPWIEAVEIRGYVTFIYLVPFSRHYHSGHTFKFLRKKDGSLKFMYPSVEHQEETVHRHIAYLCGLLPEAALNQTDDTPDSKELAITCADATEKAKGYCSRVVVQSSSEEDGIEWFFEFEKPNRFLVTQKAGEDHDRWLTIGADTYRYLGFWMRIPNDKEDAPEVNQQLVTDQYLEVLRTGQPISIRACCFSEKRPWRIGLGRLSVWIGAQNLRERYMTLLEYDVRTTSENCLLGAMKNGPWHITLWIDTETNLLARVDAANEVMDEDGESYEVKLKQVFAYMCPSLSPPDDDQELTQ